MFKIFKKDRSSLLHLQLLTSSNKIYEAYWKHKTNCKLVPCSGQNIIPPDALKRTALLLSVYFLLYILLNFILFP